MDTNTQIERLIELAIVQRTELKRLVEELPQLKEHLSAEIERTFEETEPQLRAELEEWTSKQAADKTAALGVALESKIASLAKSLEESAQAKFSAVLAARDQNADLLKQAEERIAIAASEIPGKVKEIVTAELARFPRAGEIDRLRKEFQEPRGLNPRGKWLPDETYNKLDLVTWNGDSYVSNTNDNKERPGRNAANWTLSAARGTSGGGPADLSALTAVPSNGALLIGSGTSWVNGQLSAGAGISITVGPGAITISATDGDITLDDGTAASPSLHFTNDPDTGIYRPAANTLGISVSGTQVAYFDANGITTVGAGATFDGSVHAANGNANNPSLSFTSDQDTGFFRHQPNEIGVALGGTQYATLTSTTFSITPNLVVSGTGTINGTSIPASKTLVVTTDKISALAATTSSELAGKITDETGTGSLVFANTPTLVTPILGTPQSGTLTNCTGLPVSTGVSGLGTNVATFLATPSSANLASAVTDETGTGALVFANTPTLVTPVIGAATGTSLTVTGNVTSADSILGTSGPSVKSSLSARAPRQGLVFDGSAAATIANVPAFGTSDFSLTAWLYTPSVSTFQFIYSASTNGPQLGIMPTTGTLRMTKGGVVNLTESTGTIPVGKWVHITYSRSSGTGTYYINGVSAGTTTDTQDYSTALVSLSNSSNLWLTGGLSGTFVYNRALSASEVVALYEAGAPAGADYNSASNTALNTAAWTNATGFSTFTSSSGTNVSGISSGVAAAYSNAAFTFAKGNTIRVYYDLTVTSGATPNLRLSNIGVGDASAATTLTAGTGKYVDLVATAASTGTGAVYLLVGSSTNFALTNVSVVRPGLLLAPDAAQAGGGLVWYDTSGNAANITLPASGVSWNVPSSRYLGGNWTTSGNQAVAGTLSSWGAAYKALEVGSNASVSVTGNSWFSINNAYNNGSNWVFNTNGYATVLEQNKNNGSHIWYTSNSGTAGGTPTFATLATLTRDGNLILNSTGTDGGQKLQVAGGIAATGLLDITGPDNSGANGVGNLKVYAANRTALLTFNYQNINASGALLLSTAGTTALTLNSSQNMTVEGTGVHQLKGTLLVGNQAAIGASLDVQTASGTASTFRLYQNGVSNWVWSVPASTDALVLSQYGTTEAMRFDSSRNATFAGYLSYNNVGADTKAIFNRTSGNAFSFEHETSRFTLYNRGTSGYAWLATNTGSFVVGNTADLSTNATDGFLYVPKCAGTPTGTPTAIAGKVPIVVDYTNHKLYFYSGGAWRDAGP